MLVATIKHAKQILSLLIMILLICPNSVVAAPKTRYELGIDAKANKKWKIALTHFEEALKPLPKSDPNYRAISDEITNINRVMQEEDEARKLIAETENVIEDLDRGSVHCVQRFNEGDPNVNDCVEQMGKLQSDAEAKLKGKTIANTRLDDLNVKLVPYREVNEIALRVIKTPTLSTNDFAAMDEDVKSLENAVGNPSYPQNLQVYSAVVVSNFHLISAKAYGEDCQSVIKSGQENTALGREICGRFESAAQKYGNFMQFINQNQHALTDKVPVSSVNLLAPIAERVRNWPKPDEVKATYGALVAQKGGDEPKVIGNARNANNVPHQAEPVVAGKAVETSSWWQPAIIGAGIAMTAIAGTAMWLTKKPNANKPDGAKVVAHEVMRTVGNVDSVVARQPVQSQIALERPAILNTVERLVEAWRNADPIRLKDDEALDKLQRAVEGFVSVTRPGAGRNVILRASVSGQNADPLAVEIAKIIDGKQKI